MTERTESTWGALTPLSRRGFLGGVGGLSLVALSAQATLAPPARATSDGTVLPLVEALPTGAPDRTLFDPHEQVLAAYLMILAPLANSVVDDDPELYGWMEDGWWRTPNQPYNARIMEHVSTLAWFASHERPWNPYYRDEALLGRLDAAIQYYLGIQREAGYWTEYGWNSESRAATGFGAVALSATMRDLLDADLLPERRPEIEDSLRRASTWLMDLDQYYWETPIQATNQTAALLAGVAQTAAVLEDPAIATDLADRCAYMLEHGQAPAGFFHEPLAYDAGYNFIVAIPDLGHIYEETGDPSVLAMVQRWVEWAKYAIVLEPGETYGFHVSAFSARNYTAAFEAPVADDKDRAALGRVFLPEVPALAAWHAPAEDRIAGRADWAVDPEPVMPRAKGDTSPRLWMHVPIAPAGASTAERDAQIAALPYLAEETFTESRLGTLDQQFVFVRRPSCYVPALYGERPYPRLRMGPALLWHPEAGSLVLSLNNDANSTTDDHWGTITATGVGSALSPVVATHHEGADATGAQIPADDLSGHLGVFTTRFVTSDSAITTDVSHWHDGLRRSVLTHGEAVEQIPLLVRSDDQVVFDDGTVAAPGSSTAASASGLSVTRGSTRLVISWGTPIDVELVATTRTFLGGTRQQALLKVPFSDALTTELTLVDLTEVEGERVAFAATGQTVRSAGGHHTAVHVINLDTEPTDIRVATTAGTRTFRDVAPGASRYALFHNARLLPAPGVAVATTCGDGRIRVATRRFDI